MFVANISYFFYSVFQRILYQDCMVIPFPNKPRLCAYKTFFMLNSADNEISKLDKSNLINLLEKLLTCKDFHCFCLSNQKFKFNLSYILKDKLSFKSLSTNSVEHRLELYKHRSWFYMSAVQVF